MTQTLLLVHDLGAEAGVLTQDGGRTTLAYDEGWRGGAESTALSTSLALSAREHPASAVDPWLWGLLPDNELVLERWGKAFHVSSRNAFRLLAHVGEDCPGAFRLSSPDRRDADDADVAWITPRAVAERLAAVRVDPSRTREASDRGQFSLSGAQPKIALYREGRRWGVPSGRMPTTHILKPPSGDFDGFAENEHYCLALASRVGLTAARSEVLRFGEEICIVIERFDRVRTAELAEAEHRMDRNERSRALTKLAGARPVLRVHQEDLCQALGVHPARKYQNEGGPTPKAILALLHASSTHWRDDVTAFVDALALSWILGATDAHAKNYALLHGARGAVRLAPLYDIASALPYPRLPQRKLKLAMSIGGEYGLHTIRARHWASLAKEARLPEAEVFRRVVALANACTEHARPLARDLRAHGLEHPILDTLAPAIEKRAASCARWIER